MLEENKEDAEKQSKADTYDFTAYELLMPLSLSETFVRGSPTGYLEYVICLLEYKKTESFICKINEVLLNQIF